jgi:hypothetical protein
MTATVTGEFPILRPDDAAAEAPEVPASSDKVRRIGSLAG